MPVSLMFDEITKSLANNEKVLALYLDLKKAFDTVDIHILLKKMHFLGIRGSLLNIIESYFKNRTQIVQIEQHKSHETKISMGVPQGSILGPLLFILYINDLKNTDQDGSYYFYADDTVIVLKHQTFQGLQDKIDHFIPAMTKWFLSNRLSLNASKTCFQIFSNFRNTANIDLNIAINGSQITRKFSVEYLGITVDENLKWDTHITNVSLKISRNLGIIGRVKHYLSSRELKLLYNSLILPHINYCAAVWGSNYFTRIFRIFKLQKRAVRIIDKKKLFVSFQ